MKKFLCICLTLITFVCCFAFVGCEEKALDDINYTAEKPVLNYETERYENPDKEWDKTAPGWTLKGYEPIKWFDYYKDFSEYYVQNLKGNKLFLLNVSGESLSALPPYDRYGYAYFKNKQSNEIVVRELIDYYDEELGCADPDKKGYLGWKPVSVYIEIFIKPHEKTDTSELTFEFGKLEGDVVYDKYINVYSGEECFATCYFYNRVFVSQEWLENYFKTNLIYGDDL